MGTFQSWKQAVTERYLHYVPAMIVAAHSGWKMTIDTQQITDHQGIVKIALCVSLKSAEKADRLYISHRNINIIICSPIITVMQRGVDWWYLKPSLVALVGDDKAEENVGSAVSMGPSASV